MGRAIDETGIQFKLLNRSRGPAVWSPRAQADKRVYSEWVASALGRQPGVSWIIGKAGRILTDGDRVVGLELETGERYRCGSLIVTTGTFLNGLVHVGPEQRPAGRAGEPPSQALAESLKSFGFRWGRLKTGTPPRLSRASIDFSRFDEERGDDPAVPFSFVTRRHRPRADQLPPAAHHRPGPRARAAAHRAVAAVQRANQGHRSALLPVARGQGDAVSASRAPPDLPRAGRSGRRRDLRQRILDEPPRRRPGGACEGAAWTRGCGDAAPGLCGRVRLHPADRAAADARDHPHSRALSRRSDQRHVRLRGGGGAGDRRRNQRSLVRSRAGRTSFSSAAKATSAF